MSALVRASIDGRLIRVLSWLPFVRFSKQQGERCAVSRRATT